MLFSSMTFVYIFLPLVCIAYFFVRPETRNCLLLLASIILYGWGEPNYLAVMIMTILLNYTGALLLDRYRCWKLPIAVVTILLDLSFLCYFKYFNFVAENINGLFSLDIKFIEVIMPIGISFYTFQAMSYLLDVYRGGQSGTEGFVQIVALHHVVSAAGSGSDSKVSRRFGSDRV